MFKHVNIKLALNVITQGLVCTVNVLKSKLYHVLFAQKISSSFGQFSMTVICHLSFILLPSLFALSCRQSEI